jgi:hypothetical protein
MERRTLVRSLFFYYGYYYCGYRCEGVGGMHHA